MRAPQSWDVFCRVIDNFGDAAVCWRLAHGLAHQAADTPPRVRLWIDDLRPLRALRPAIASDRDEQRHAGVEICRWSPDAEFGAPAEVAVDAFGAGLPPAYEEAMAAVPDHARPLCIVLEYLSAEPWVAAHHGLPSPHPRLPLERYFFFPGFEPGTGGLLREPDLAARREQFLGQPAAQEALWRDIGFAPPPADATLVTLFGYENAAVHTLLDIWSNAPQPIVVAVPGSRLGVQLASMLGIDARAGLQASAGLQRTVQRGALEIRFMPFLPQDRYDQLLWSADWNFVRGEDSFVRAQWAERPFLWQPYQQAAGAHLLKLDAFLDLYCSGLPEPLAMALRTVTRVWNGAPEPDFSGGSPATLADSVQTLTVEGAALRRHAQSWAARMANLGDMVGNLTQFCSKRLK
jgi:uncharacterized repeat protein (TIGR03837 family)